MDWSRLVPTGGLMLTEPVSRGERVRGGQCSGFDACLQTMNQAFEQVGLKRILLSIISQSVNLKAFNHFQSLHSPSSVPSVPFSPCTVNIFSIHHMICLEGGGSLIQ